MYRTYAIRLPSLLLLGVAWLFFAATTLSAAEEELITPADEEPVATEDENNPFADSLNEDDSPVSSEAELNEDQFDDPNFMTEDYLGEEYYDEGPCCDDRSSNCFGEGDQFDCRYPGCRKPYCSPNSWFKAGYVLFWTKSVDLPILATTSPVGTDPNDAGVIGEAATGALFGGSSVLGDTRGGGKFELGYWLDPSHTAAIELEYLFLGEKNDDFRATEDDVPILARPFLNVGTGLQDSRLIVFDNLIEGTLAISTDTNLHTSALAYRNLLYSTGDCRIDYLLGYRFAYLADSISIAESTLALDGSNAPGTTIDLVDRFETQNTFHGAEFGFDFQKRIDRIWDCTFNARIALGGGGLETNIRGRTITDDGASTVVSSGGLLTQDSNIGSYRDTEFNAVSNIGLTLRRKVFTNASVSFGYHFFMWSNVWRAADQIDTNINTSQIDGPLVGAALPAFPGTTDSYWAQGLSFNLEGRF